MDFFEAYGVAASKLNSPILISGRSLFNDNIELIVADIVRKLEINSKSSLLEIGCGVGLLLTPLSCKVTRAVGVDHEQCIDKYKEFGVPNNVELIPGRWPLIELAETFDCVVVYSVMHYMKDPKEAFQFIDKALLSLKNNGKLLLADIPNSDMFKRFNSSEIKEYKELKALHENHETQAQSSIFSNAIRSASYLDDGFVLWLLKDLRARGYDTYILPQPSELPYSYSREDILIWKR
jgi:cyclopropane fatty-acyl-phospholipid synthase-like methyltransferase